MKIIYADKLIDALGIRDCYKYKNPKAYDTLMLYEILQAIEDQPIAYDVDKVVNDLEYASYCKSTPTFDRPYTDSIIDLEEAMDIVKRGGVDEK